MSSSSVDAAAAMLVNNLLANNEPRGSTKMASAKISYSDDELRKEPNYSYRSCRDSVVPKIAAADVNPLEIKKISLALKLFS